jgi:hypothetical protein
VFDLGTAKAGMKIRRIIQAHACNLYLGGRDGEDNGLRPVREKSLRAPFSINKNWCGDIYLSSQLQGKRKEEDQDPGINMRP